jgi:V8-like Glu-specific endopeptidase
MRTLVAGVLLAAGTLAGCTGSSGSEPRAATTPSEIGGSADVLQPDPAPGADAPAEAPLQAVGALFGAGSADHYCTAAVVHSRSGLLAMTAAHCLVGTGAGLRFVPGYGPSGSGPAGSWTVEAVYATNGWRTTQDPSQDYAVLRLTATAPDPALTRGRPLTVEGRVGSVGTPGAAPGPAPAPASLQTVDVRGYPAGRQDPQRACTTAITSRNGSPSIDCDDFGPGTSGAPWLTSDTPGTGTLVGLIGGFQQGGCGAQVSYSPTFDASTTALLARADSGGAGDTMPRPGDDGC